MAAITKRQLKFTSKIWWDYFSGITYVAKILAVKVWATKIEPQKTLLFGWEGGWMSILGQAAHSVPPVKLLTRGFSNSSGSKIWFLLRCRFIKRSLMVFSFNWKKNLGVDYSLNNKKISNLLSKWTGFVLAGRSYYHKHCCLVAPRIKLSKLV